MPRIPTYQPGQVGPVQYSEARFRAPDIAPSGLARGMQGLGQALGEYANAQDHLIATSEDTQARTAALQARAQVNGLLTQYNTLQGGNAVDAQSNTLEQIKAVKDNAATTLTSPRMKKFFDQHFGETYADAVDRVNGHAVRQVQVQRQGALQAEAESFSDQAITEWQNPELRDKAIAAGGMSLMQLGHMLGHDDTQIALDGKKYVSGIHRNTIDRMLASENPDPEAALAYYHAHASDMLAADSESVMKDLQGPMQAREADSDFVRATGGGIVADAGKPAAAGAVRSIDRMVAITASTESGGQERGGNGQLVTSVKGAQGKMQVMPGTQRDPGFGITPMRDNSDAERTRVGNEYLAKMMERYGNDPAKAWAAYNWGPGHLDDAIEKHGSGWLANAPKETRDYVAKNMAHLDGSGHSTEAPQQWDKDQTYNKIDTLADKEGWTFERRERAKKRADTVISRDEDLLNRQYRAAGQDAVQTIGGLGDNFTDISQIPRSIRDKADPTDVMRWTEVAQKNRDAKAVIPKDGARSVELQIMARTNPDAFLNVDLAKEVGKVAPDELLQFGLKQADLVGAKNKPPAAYEPRSGINAAIAWGKKYGGTDVPDADFPKVYDTMDAILQGVYKKKGAVEQSDYDNAFKASVREYPTTGVLWNGSMKAYQVSRVDQIPEKTMGNIDRTLTQVLKRAPTDKERLDMYHRLLAGM